MRLEAMTGYCKTKTCLRGYILEYFGQKHPEVCGSCGTCKGDFETRDITREAQMILSCIRRIHDRLGYYVGQTIVLRVLQGSRDKRVLENNLQELSTYGLMKGTGSTELRMMIDHLEMDGYIQTGQEHQTLQLTPKAGEVLYRGKAVQILVRKEPEELELSPAVKKILGITESELLEELKELRSKLAREAGIPPYMIFTNATLADMAKKQPGTMSEFRKVSGVGEIKAAWYGTAFLKRIQKFKDENG